MDHENSKTNSVIVAWLQLQEHTPSTHVDRLPWLFIMYATKLHNNQETYDGFGCLQWSHIVDIAFDLWPWLYSTLEHTNINTILVWIMVGQWFPQWSVSVTNCRRHNIVIWCLVGGKTWGEPDGQDDVHCSENTSVRWQLTIRGTHSESMTKPNVDHDLILKLNRVDYKFLIYLGVI